MSALKNIAIPDFKLESGKTISLKLSYQLFGPVLGSAPVVMVNHALTGNSHVTGKQGWWSDLIGKNKVIDTNTYTVLCFNIPGNGYDGVLIENYKDFVARDMAKLFLKGLNLLEIKKLFALIGGSLGGGIAWEMAVLSPHLAEHFIPVASDWKATDWMIANCHIQEQLLLNSTNPVHDARLHAMMCYRTPASFKSRFKRSKNLNLNLFNVESWLLHHGQKLQERFQLSAYKLMNQLLKTIDVTENRADGEDILNQITSKITIVGVDSDLFFTAEENRETHKHLAVNHNDVTYQEIVSEHGHDAFLIEFEQLKAIIGPIFQPQKLNPKMKILKFGGKSLANGEGLQRVITIIKDKIKNKEAFVVVVSARGQATDQLLELLEMASQRQDYKESFEAFKAYQIEPCSEIDLSAEFSALHNIFYGVQLLGDYSEKIKAEVLGYGEIIASKMVAGLLSNEGVPAQAVNAVDFIKTEGDYCNSVPLDELSQGKVASYFSKTENTAVKIVTGFIGSNLNNEITLLGRNGSNYSAALLANYLNADELQNYTHVNGIYTANPDLVADAQKITELSYAEANELANFGTTVLHAKTIIPLIEKNIRLRILNTFNPNDEGTLISDRGNANEVTSLSVLENVALVHLEGRGLLGKIGVDARIFKALSQQNISVSIISQGSSERGIGLVIDADKAVRASEALQREFEHDFHTKDVSKIEVINNVSVISIIGIALSAFHKPFNALIKNQITPLLFNNTITGKNVSLVVRKNELHKAVNVIHGEVFSVSKKINIAIFGHGGVGGALIDQILKSSKDIESRKGIRLNIFAVANSKQVLFDHNGVGVEWKERLKKKSVGYSIQDIIDYAQIHHLENLIAVDNTSSSEFYKNYIPLVEAGFDLVSSNKIANTISHSFYKELRQHLDAHKKNYLYETTVGAGLPLIDTIKLLHESGENITRIRGVFSGTLSYLFNNFSESNNPFSSIVQETIDKGFTEPNPREDFSGNDVARKLLILARELDLKNEFSDISVENLVPEPYRNIPTTEFLEQLNVLDHKFQAIKENQKKGYVLRYVGDLSGDLSKDQGELEVKLVSVPKDSTLGHVKGSDAIFEIFTESYGEQPIVIQGAGAGAQVTARGVFGDILRLSKHIS